MKIIKDDIWKYRSTGYIVVPTNGVVNRYGEAVMGRGLALQTKQKYPEFPRLLARHIFTVGNVPGLFHKYSIITFPVKHHWQDKASVKLIEDSAILLRKFIRAQRSHPKRLEIYMPKVGCGNGQLDWKDVEPIIERYCPYVTVIDWN